MQLLHYIEIKNFKKFSDVQRIELSHPSVLIGPNNSGKTSAIQALALWSQAVKTWYDKRRETKAKKNAGAGLNRLSIVAVPVQRTRFFWHNTRAKSVPLELTVGVNYNGASRPLTMKFNHQGDEVVYCQPSGDGDRDMEFLAFAAGIKVELLYSMSGLETEEPVLQPGRIDVLLGQGQTAQVLRNLCLMVYRDNPANWTRVAGLMSRLFGVQLSEPLETARGSIQLLYDQPSVQESLDVSVAGRGFQQMLLVFAYLYSHPGSVLLVDEPDAHLEILRQKQVYVLLRDIASENLSQVILVTHSEVILDEALENNLTLLQDGKVEDLASKPQIRASLKLFGADHYVKAKERGYVLYVEGGTDVDMLRALAEHLKHPVARIWDERLNSFYVQNNYPSPTPESELERVEGGFGQSPKNHFDGLREVLPGLKGLALLDNDGRDPPDKSYGSLEVVYWKRYEMENYFVTPTTLERFVLEQYRELELFSNVGSTIQEVLDGLIQESIFDGDKANFLVWRESTPDAARLVWDATSSRKKLSTFAEEFFRRIATKLGGGMLLRKGDLHRLVRFSDAGRIPEEVGQKLTRLEHLFREARNL